MNGYVQPLTTRVGVLGLWVALTSVMVASQDNIETRSVPSASNDLIESIARYKNVRSASVAGWIGEKLLIRTRFGETSQLHLVATPLGMRQQLTFADEPIGGVAVPRQSAVDSFVYLKDVGGSESYTIFRFDIGSKTETQLSSSDGRHTGVSYNPESNKLAYSSTKRTGQYSDLYVLDLDTDEEQLVYQIDDVGWSVTAWHPDQPRVLVRKYISVAESQLYELNLETKELTRLLASYGKIAIGGVNYRADGSIIIVSDHASNFRKIFWFNTEEQVLHPLIESDQWDINSFALSWDRSQMIYSENVDGYTQLYWYNFESHLSKPLLKELTTTGQVSGIRFNTDGSKLAFNYQSARQQNDVFVLDVEANEVSRWTQSELGALDQSELVAPTLFRYPSFDGLEIPAFMFKPRGDGPHPVLIYIHGGPASQYRPRFSTRFQYYVNELGLTVIAPNVRGSNGYGQEYLALDDWEKREDSVRDIGALLAWIETQSTLNSELVIVDGGSYGGYMVLACMVHYGDRLAGGSERVGISNFVTFLENTQGYRRDLRRVEYGDERDPEMREFLNTIAPMNHLDRIVKPLLVVQGLNDPRVPASESEQLVHALEQRDIPVWYVLYKDEGHGVRKKENQDHSFMVQVQFLQSLLEPATATNVD